LALLSFEDSSNRQAQARALWDWLINQYDYERLEQADWPEGLSNDWRDIVQQYERETNRAPRAPTCDIQLEGAAPGFDTDKRETTCVFTVSAKPDKLQVLSNKRWFDVSDQDQEWNDKEQKFNVRIRLKPEAEKSDTPRPEGILVGAKVQGRWYYQRQPVRT